MNALGSKLPVKTYRTVISLHLTVKARSIVRASIPQYRTSSSITHSSPCSNADTSVT